MKISKISRSIMPDVSFDIMVESQKKIRSAYQNLANTQFPEFKDFCESIYNNVTKTLDMASSSKIQVKIQIDNTKASISTSNTLIKALQAQIDSGGDPDTILPQIKSLREQGDGFIDTLIESTENKSKDLQTEASNIEFYDFKELVDEKIDKLNKDLNETVLPNIEKYEALVAEAEEDYNNITAAMKVFEDRGVLDFYFDTIPTAEELAELLDIAVGSPELAAVLLALDIYKKFLGELGDGFSYVKLGQARDLVRRDWDEYLADLEKYNQRKKQIEFDLEDLGNISLIESERFVFTEQVRNLARAYSIFVEDINLLMKELGEYGNYDPVIERMDEMIAYLDAL